MQLPFVQAPEAPLTRRLGTSKSGVLEMSVLGGFTVGESTTINELLASEQSAFVAGARIADSIAKAENISISEAFAIVEASIAGSELEEAAELIRMRHAAAIQQVARLYMTAGQRNREATVTALVRSRCGLPEWSLADTRKMHDALFNAIWELAQEESLAEDTPTATPTDEELGKPPAADGAATKRTGSRSSGT